MTPSDPQMRFMTSHFFASNPALAMGEASVNEAPANTTNAQPVTIEQLNQMEDAMRDARQFRTLEEKVQDLKDQGKLITPIDDEDEE